VNDKLVEEMKSLEDQLARGDEAVKEVETKAKKIEQEKKELDKQVNFNCFCDQVWPGRYF